MKKTFTINISGIIFHIDEDAFEKLNAYIANVKKHFKHTEGNQEIIADIESRIAEILQEMISETKQVVTLEDVNAVIETMGQPSEFDEEQENNDFEQATYRKAKRLFRDPDNRYIGGVASGLGAYFNIDVVWVRLFFILITLLPGASILLYIIMWIVVPEARSTAERLEMRGEKVNISNIEKSIREEVDHLKDKLNDMTRQAKQGYKKKDKFPRNGFEEILKFFIEVFKIFFKVIIVILGIALFLIGMALLVTFFTSFFGWGDFVFVDNHALVTFPLPRIMDMIFGPADNTGLLRTGLLFALGIPIIMLVYSAIRLIFRIERSKTLGIIALNFWIVGVLICTFFAFKTAKSFSEYARYEKSIPIEQIESDTIYISLNRSDFYHRLDMRGDYDEIYEWDVIFGGNGDHYFEPDLFIRPSDDSTFSLMASSYARGSDKEVALQRASETEYSFLQEDNILRFDPYYRIPYNTMWREQDLNVILEVPVGKTVIFGSKLYRILSFSRGHYYYRDRDKARIMTEDGLELIDYDEKD